MVIVGGQWGVNGGGGRGCEYLANKEGADIVGVKVGGEECPGGKCYRGGLRLSIGFLAHAGSVMIE